MNLGYFIVLAATTTPSALWSQSSPVLEIPKAWEETALEEWATPVAGLNVRPTHISSSEYYSVPEYSLRSYPVYMPSREPAGYWDMLQQVGPKPLIERDKLKTEAEWTEAGRRVFDEATSPQLTTFDPRMISLLRDREYLEKVQAVPLPDGTLGTLRWVPTEEILTFRTEACIELMPPKHRLPPGQ